ncbi:MAG: GIN domain-containing protein [Bacteroidales bacterium]
MKKSNIILLITFGLAFTWTLIVGGLGAAAINSFRQGHNSTYVFTSDEHSQVVIRPSSAPIKELRITGDRSVLIILKTGPEFTVDCMRHDKNYITVINQDGIATIRVEKLPTQGAQMQVTIPELVKVSVDSVFELVINGIAQNNLSVQCRQSQVVDINGCKIRRLTLDFPDKLQKNNVMINESNRFDSLSVSMAGYGTLRLGCMAKSQNLMQVSPKVEIHTRQEIYKHLTFHSNLPVRPK